MIPLKDDTPTVRSPLLTIAFIAVNVLAFVWQVGVEGLQLSALRGGVIPYEVITLGDVGPAALVPPPFTILTSMFLHGGLMHIGGNMLFLWVFGNNVEDALGRGRFVLFYVVCGVAAALAETWLAVATGEVMVPMVGDSGATAGVLAAYMVLYPRAQVLTLVPIFIFIRLIWLPAVFFIGVWFVFQLLSGFDGAGGGVAFFAHIGGFVAGFVLVKLFPPERTRRWRQARRAWW